MIEDVLSELGGNGTANYTQVGEDEDTIGDSVIAKVVLLLVLVRQLQQLA